jgi:hypothetical protein
MLAHAFTMPSSDSKQVIAETQDDWAELALGKIPAKEYWIGSK